MFTMPVMADVTYSYTGNDFTVVSGSYTNTDFVGGSFIVSTALAGGLAEGSISVVSYSFSGWYADV